MTSNGNRVIAATHRSAPLVSVIIPTFNAARHLGETIENVLAQTLSAVEIIVVDDGSSDGTVGFVESTYPRVRVVQQRNAGVSAARNNGLSVASGRYVCFLDQDDVWHPLKLERQVACLDGDETLAAVACPFAFWHPAADGTYSRSAQPPDPGLALEPGFERWTYHHFLIDCWALTSATMLRTAAVRASGGFDVALPYSEDWDLWLRLSRHHGFAMITWPLVLYRQHAVQGSRKVRRIDYRYELLRRAARRYGLKNPDGTGLTASEFRHRLALYKTQFGYHHLQHGDRWVAVTSLLRAWALQPSRWRNIGFCALALAGWRPAISNAAG